MHKRSHQCIRRGTHTHTQTHTHTDAFLKAHTVCSIWSDTAKQMHWSMWESRGRSMLSNQRTRPPHPELWSLTLKFKHPRSWPHCIPSHWVWSVCHRSSATSLTTDGSSSAHVTKLFPPGLSVTNQCTVFALSSKSDLCTWSFRSSIYLTHSLTRSAS